MRVGPRYVSREGKFWKVLGSPQSLLGGGSGRELLGALRLSGLYRDSFPWPGAMGVTHEAGLSPQASPQEQDPCVGSPAGWNRWVGGAGSRAVLATGGSSGRRGGKGRYLLSIEKLRVGGGVGWVDKVINLFKFSFLFELQERPGVSGDPAPGLPGGSER